LVIFSTKKSVSYTEHNDDDDGKFFNSFPLHSILYDSFYLDFVSKVDNTKKPRNTKTNDHQTESNLSTRQPPRKRNEKFVLFKSLNQSIKSIFY